MRVEIFKFWPILHTGCMALCSFLYANELCDLTFGQELHVGQHGELKNSNIWTQITQQLLNGISPRFGSK